MDYGKSGAPRKDRSVPRHGEHRIGGKGAPERPQSDKAELLARMKRATAAKDGGEGGKTPLDVPSDPADDFAIDEAKGKDIRGPEHLDGGEPASDPKGERAKS